ncbi:MAG: P1 family peptidase [Rhizobiales bacterium]|nr:P1 family peptidase [Hyphomicrobiales bacterium]MBO6697786.1 P1 family peptidase [Hyphomicrobiales bacterium]MBO6735959.1 P1 family peptidase [Hyphomicrobiales bacterium]MBO6912429.1 P1 family peptidase [Hyphomicrobiales bacterium]MBO6955059.1 P1 family peptidase [Hyphomicrobiales bacterium]
MWHKGETNSPADIAGVRIGHASDQKAKTGTSVVVFDSPSTASVSILGQAPGTRETELLDPSRTVDRIDALVLSGGSAFGLAATEPVVQELAKAGRGFQAGPARVPIVPAAILFDLANGGEKPDDLQAHYRSLGQSAFHNADRSPRLGEVGAGAGATIGTGGSGALGMASCVFGKDAPESLQGKTVAALVAVNAVGSPFLDRGPYLRAWPFELDDEFGGLGAGPVDPTRLFMKTLAEPGQNTTIGCIITDTALDKRGCHSLAIAGQDGIAAAIYPAHTALDGDLVFGASVATSDPLSDPGLLALVQAAGTATMARSIARGIHKVLQKDRSML